MKIWIFFFSLILIISTTGISQEPAKTRGTLSPRFEAGPVASLTTFGTAVSVGNVEAGFGGRLTVNATKLVGFEYQMSFFSNTGGYPAKMTEGSGHVKFTYRMEENHRFNLFAVIGPGFLREKEEWFSGTGHHELNYTSVGFDFGAGIEIVPHKRFALRIDATDFNGGKLSAGNHLDFKFAGMFRF